MIDIVFIRKKQKKMHQTHHLYESRKKTKTTSIKENNAEKNINKKAEVKKRQVRNQKTNSHKLVQDTHQLAKQTH